MLRVLYDLTTGSLNPSYLTGYLAGGSGAAVSGTTPNPGMAYPRRETVEQGVLDVTASGEDVTPAAQGKLLVEDLTLENIVPGSAGGATWRLSSTLSQQIPRGKYGIVNVPGFNDPQNPVTAADGTSQGVGAQVVLDGPINAFCTAITTAVAPGSLLAADGAGNLCVAPNDPGPGEVLAVAAGTLAITTTPTLISVDVGGM